MEKSGIYAITNKVNGMVYVGSSRQLRTRKQQHMNELIKNKHGNQHLQNSFNLYGKDNLEFIILEYVEDIKIIFEREQYYMDLFDACNREKGYNISNNAKVPILFGENNPNFGRNFSKEHRKKISEALKQNNYMSGRKGILHPRYGIKASNETRERISEANKRRDPKSYEAIRQAKKLARRGRSPSAKTIVQLTKKSEYIAQYDSIMSAQDITDVKRPNISSCLIGKSKTAGGYKWMYINDYKALL